MTKTGKWARRAVWGTLVAVLTIGCNPITTLGFLLHKDNMAPAEEYALRPKDGPKKDKEQEISVLVLCAQQTNSTVPDQFIRLDSDLAVAISKRMPEEALANKEKITVISPSRLNEYKMKNRGWSSEHATVIGKKLGADYVLDISLSSIQVYQPGSRNSLYDGRVNTDVDVYDISSGQKEPKHHYTHQFVYRPNHTPDATPDTGVNISLYKQGFVNRLALELTWKHLDHKPADGIAAER
jgi:hypothetical protein